MSEEGALGVPRGVPLDRSRQAVPTRDKRRMRRECRARRSIRAIPQVGLGSGVLEEGLQVARRRDALSGMTAADSVRLRRFEVFAW